jgi:hypothetical protein
VEALTVDAQLADHVVLLYPLAIDLMAREMPPEVREGTRALLFRASDSRSLDTPLTCAQASASCAS